MPVRNAVRSPAQPSSNNLPELPRTKPVDRLAELERSPSESRLLWMAEERAVSDCMRARGFTYLPNPPDERNDEAVAFARIEAGDVDAARAVGYGLAEAISQGELPKDDFDANAAQIAQMPPERRTAFLEALSGPAVPPNAPNATAAVETVPLPGGGSASWYRDSCLAQARREVYGDDYAHNELGYGDGMLRERVREEVEHEPAYAAGLQRWRACMRGRGFDYARPEEPSAALATAFHDKQITLDELRQREQRVASADASCHNEAQLATLRQQAEARSEQVLVRARQDDLLAMRSAREQASVRAREVLRESDDEE